MKTQEKNPVLLYKAQGQIPPQGYENLSHKDFAIAIQTPLQAEILKRFSSDRVICVDSTHGTNSYNFSLITVMVIDEYGEGFPVAWCISNREDHPLLLIFYKAIKSKVGVLTPKWFMSDLAEQFFSIGYQPSELVIHPIDCCAHGMLIVLGGKTSNSFQMTK